MGSRSSGLDLVTRMMESPAALSLKELIALKPTLLKEIIADLRAVSRNKPKKVLQATIDHSSETSDEEGSDEDISEAESIESDCESFDELSDSDAEMVNGDEDEPKRMDLSYIMVTIAGQPVPMLVDTGADFCIVSASLVRRLGLAVEPLTRDFTISPVGGARIKLESMVRLHLK